MEDTKELNRNNKQKGDTHNNGQKKPDQNKNDLQTSNE